MNAFNFNHVASAAFNTLAAGKTQAQAVKAAAATIKQAKVRDLAALCVLWTESCKTRDALNVADIALGAETRARLKADGVDVTVRRDVAAALKPGLWAAEGIEPCTVKENKALYMRIAKRAERAVDGVCGKPEKVATEKTQPVVSRDTMALVVSKRDAGKTKAQVKAEMLAAIERAFA